jgi:hypothetical protein
MGLIMSIWTYCLIFGNILVASGLAADVDLPFVFNENVSSIVSNTSGGLNQVNSFFPELIDMKPVETASDPFALQGIHVGGGGAEGTIEITLGDQISLCNSRVEPNNPKIQLKAYELAGAKYPGYYPIEQVCSVYAYLEKDWHYMSPSQRFKHFLLC